LIVGWCGQFLFFVVPRKFRQVVGEWPGNQILIPNWTNFHCPGTTLLLEPFLETKLLRDESRQTAEKKKIIPKKENGGR